MLHEQDIHTALLNLTLFVSTQQTKEIYKTTTTKTTSEIKLSSGRAIKCEPRIGRATARVAHLDGARLLQARVGPQSANGFHFFLKFLPLWSPPPLPPLIVFLKLGAIMKIETTKATSTNFRGVKGGWRMKTPTTNCSKIVKFWTPFALFGNYRAPLLPTKKITTRENDMDGIQFQTLIK